LENSRAIMWSQALTLYKLTEMDTVPVILASELQVLLESMKQNIEPQQSLLALPSLGVPVISKTLHDRHQRASRIRTLLQEIRALPGLEHFMFGSSYSELAAAATRYTVVVLVATDQACWAVVVRPPQQQPEAIVLDVEKKTLQHLVISADEPWARGAPMPDADLERSMRINRKSRQPAVHAKLNQLWVSIVKPVLQNLHLQVSHTFRSVQVACLNSVRRFSLVLMVIPVPVYAGVPLAASPRWLSMLLAYMEKVELSVALITWYHLTLQHSLPFSEPNAMRQAFGLGTCGCCYLLNRELNSTLCPRLPMCKTKLNAFRRHSLHLAFL
jgi:hypothetical protein